ncbi:hypothetical protein M231_04979 [Tremella mesenterica]|uniref:Mitochondrial protein n=1 Tax=Tremella mesenterica TaxID=5217 RepID=A0A4Q1BJA3_TREME|nr:hypothetical protein M231_04979 [Tremella mesenterica]
MDARSDKYDPSSPITLPSASDSTVSSSSSNRSSSSSSSNLDPTPPDSSSFIISTSPDRSSTNTNSPGPSKPLPPSPSATSAGVDVTDQKKSDQVVISTLPPLPDLPPPPPTRTQHPFDTHAFVTYLEKSQLEPGVARTLMQAVRELIVRRGDRTRESMLGREDMENVAYLFRAALSELRTELSVRARNDGAALKAMAGAIRREVDQLEQKMKEDVGTLKHDIEMDMNNRKSETRSELKGFDIAIEEINNKFTISLGDLRTEIESAKWDATRRAIAIIVLIVVSAIGVSMVTTGPDKSTPPPRPKPTVMRDVAVGTEDEPLGLELDEERLDKLLAESGVGRRLTGQKKEKTEMDRIQ